MSTTINPAYLYNYFWDHTDPAHPFKVALVCNLYSLVPDYATRIRPPDAKEGMTPCWTGDKWAIRMDWRKVKMWDKTTGKEVTYPTVDFNVDDAQNYTQTEPPSPFSVWQNNTWVFSEEKEATFNCQELNKQRLNSIEKAGAQINILNDIVLYDDGTLKMKKYNDLLLQWRKYRGQLAIMQFKTGKETLPDTPPNWDTLDE